MRLPVRFLALATLALSNTALCAQEPRAAASRPTLVLFLTVDQMRSDYFPRFEKQLTGGLGRLYHGGAFFSNAFQDHAITETAPGHSTTMSGRFPRSTGIIMNAAGVEDPNAPLLGGGGPGASPFRFRGSTLTDWLRVANPRSRALSISRKDRAAILPIGRQPEEVYWYASDGRFTTSTYYHDTLPQWVQQFNARRLPQKYAGQSWSLLLAANAYPEPDTVSVEHAGNNYVFPHQFPTDSEDAARLLPNYPVMDDVSLQMALAGVEAMGLGRGPQTDVLAVSLSSTDAVGHAYGPDSRELHDQIVRLDRSLGIFLDSLFKLRDPARIVIALTADHGVAPYSELESVRLGKALPRADIQDAVSRFRQRLATRGIPAEAFRAEEAVLYVDRPAFTRAGVNADSVIRAAADTLQRLPGILRVDFVRELTRKDTVRDAIARRWYHMLLPELPAELVVTTVPFVYWEGVTYATHGTPHDYDAHVPVLFFGAPFKPGIYDEFARVVDMAPTLANVLGVPPLERLDGHVLARALR